MVLIINVLFLKLAKVKPQIYLKNDDWREKVNHYKQIWNMNLGIQKQNNTGFTIPKPQST